MTNLNTRRLGSRMFVNNECRVTNQIKIFLEIFSWSQQPPPQSAQIPKEISSYLQEITCVNKGTPCQRIQIMIFGTESLGSRTRVSTSLELPLPKDLLSRSILHQSVLRVEIPGRSPCVNMDRVTRPRVSPRLVQSPSVVVRTDWWATSMFDTRFVRSRDVSIEQDLGSTDPLLPTAGSTVQKGREM